MLFRSDELKAYLDQFPTGLFAAVARARLKALESTQVATISPAPSISPQAPSVSTVSAETAFKQGEEAAKRGDYVEAVRLYRLAANQGNPAAQYNLGVMYENGRGGLAKDDAEAVRLYRLAANQGNPTAQASLGFMYAQGRGGLQKDLSEAKRWYQLAARQNFQPAQEAVRRLNETW